MRIVSLSPSITELLFALGFDEEIVGVTKYCDFPEKAKSKPQMGGWSDSDLVKVRAANPDIVFTSTVVQQSVYDNAKLLGLNIVHVDPRTLKQVLESFITIGSLVGRGKEAEDLVAHLNTEFEKLRNVPSARIYVEEWPSTVSCNWVPDVVEIAGGISLGRSGMLSHPITIEDIKRFDPDIIVISWCGVSIRVPKEKIIERPGWKDLRAVKNDKIFIIDDSLLNRPGPRLLDGAQLLSKLVQEVSFSR